jgi:hypothetical protein
MIWVYNQNNLTIGSIVKLKSGRFHEVKHTTRYYFSVYDSDDRYLYADIDEVRYLRPYTQPKVTLWEKLTKTIG